MEICKNFPLPQLIKGTLMQIWKSANIFVFPWKQYVEDLTLKHFLRLRYAQVSYVKSLFINTFF